MKKPLLFLALALSFGQVIAQKSSVWHKATLNVASKFAKVRTDINEESAQYFSLDIDTFRQSLTNAKNKFSNLPGVVVEFPNMNGEIEKFQVWENSNMEPSFQAQFPQIRAYVGKGISDKGATINFSVSPKGVQTMLFRADNATEFIEAYDKGAHAYMVFNNTCKTGHKAPFTCGTPEAALNADLFQNPTITAKSSAGSYKTMRLALSCTGEYAASFGATTSGTASDKALVLAAMNATMTRVNGVFEKDFAVHLNMIDNTSVIYYDSTTDPYSDAANMNNWNTELMNTLHSVLGDAAFDIGHMFGASGGGGNAGCIGCVCTNVLSTGGGATSSYKGSGITSPGSGLPQGDSFDIDYVAHEMGHQLGGNHTFTFSGEGNSAGTKLANYQVEPGSGSTIMGYAGITSYDVQAHSDPYFSYKSIAQVQTNLNTKTCPVSTSLTGTNAAPVVNAGADYTIPIGTAFMLSGTATDADASDVLTYLWEESDFDTTSTTLTGTGSRVLATKTTGPNFRTFKPSTNNFRYFPQMGKIMSGVLTVTTAGNSNWETCSTVARTLNFSLTARDNRAGMGQTGVDAMIVTVNATGGAFSVTSQGTTGISYAGNSTQTVTWNPGSTASAPFNSPTVDILMTTNASTALEVFNSTTPSSPNPTTWTTIASGVPNTGSYDVTIPNVASSTSTCRFMVKAVGNIFLAVNSKNFTVTPALANETFEFTNFSLYPNPSHGSFNVKFDSTSEKDITVSIFDIRGREVFNKSYQNNGVFDQDINLSQVESGVYMVNIVDGGKKMVKKLVIE
ncbi:zinc-dependent metalloprotease [Flavobacterium aciduliphilum]|uniref:Putative secreted protein (Por secretion system target) n=1 Tax=Flavobacterium aciduliphilum TaxID=1101402 RepID=A0A328YG80_9FLAO|nr:zinc-dependent metalloprotease [Flavobacterium aciduliphilum]RAR72630.1 putative secreted protein (Por secretion system target) [Flavobacterium aciduliphilum]